MLVSELIRWNTSNIAFVFHPLDVPREARPLPYRPVMWLPLGLLNLGLIVRVAGDLAGHTAAYKTGGTLTVLAVLVFAVTMIGVVTTARRERAAV